MIDADEFRGLISRWEAGDRSVAAELDQHFGPLVRAAIRRHLHPRLRTQFDSLDFVQDVWSSFLAMPPGAHEFATPTALVGFLHRMASYKVVEVFRNRFQTQKNDITRERPIDSGEEGGECLHPAAGASASQWAIAHEEWDRLLRQFPHGHRAIIERLRDGYTHEEIARMADVSISTVNRIVRRLKELTGC